MTTDNPWDARYADHTYFYGTAPNDFLLGQAHRLAPGSRVLCLAEGEGRNAVFLAGRLHKVTAVDSSTVGLRKARQLADQRGVQLQTIPADLADFSLGTAAWDAVVSIWCHLPPPLRRDLHRRVVAALKPGGWLLLEAYHPRQVGRGTGGPPTAEPMMTLDGLRQELAGLEFVHAAEIEREVQEGAGHHGWSAVTQVVGRKVQ